MTAPTNVAGLGVNVSRPGVAAPATATKADERGALYSPAMTLPAPSPTPLAGAPVRVIGGPYWQMHGRVGHVWPSAPGRYVRVLIRESGEARFLDLLPGEVTVP